MPNVMVALPNTVGALCSTLQSLADAHYYCAKIHQLSSRNKLSVEIPVFGLSHFFGSKSDFERWFNIETSISRKVEGLER